jgi:hypothetical protein
MLITGRYNEATPTDFADRMTGSLPFAVYKFVYQGATSHLASTIDKYVIRFHAHLRGTHVPMKGTYLQAWRRLGSRSALA